MHKVPSLGRFPGLEASALSAEQVLTLDELVDGRGMIPAPYRFLIASPKVVQHLGALGTDLRKTGELTRREMEIVILVTAQHLGSSFVKAAHRRLGGLAGLSDDIMDAILEGRVPDLADPRERAAYEVTVALHRDAAVPQEQANAAERVLGLKTIAEIIAFIGNYTVTCYTMRFVDAQAPARPAGSSS